MFKITKTYVTKQDNENTKSSKLKLDENGELSLFSFTEEKTKQYTEKPKPKNVSSGFSLRRGSTIKNPDFF